MTRRIPPNPCGARTLPRDGYPSLPVDLGPELRRMFLETDDRFEDMREVQLAEYEIIVPMSLPSAPGGSSDIPFGVFINPGGGYYPLEKFLYANGNVIGDDDEGEAHASGSGMWTQFMSGTTLLRFGVGGSSGSGLTELEHAGITLLGVGPADPTESTTAPNIDLEPPGVTPLTGISAISLVPNSAQPGQRPTIFGGGGSEISVVVPEGEVWAVCILFKFRVRIIASPDEPGGAGRKFLRFMLDGGLTTSTEAAPATIDSFNQWGQGQTNPNASITVMNVPGASPGTYKWEGEPGDIGIAFHNTAGFYVIVKLWSSAETSEYKYFQTISVSGEDDVVAEQQDDTLTLVAGGNITITTDASADSITIAASGSIGEYFKTIVVSGQSDVVADIADDTLTLVAGTGITITTNAGTDTITFTSSGMWFKTISVSGQDNVVADAVDDTLTLVGGNGLDITTTAASDTITFTVDPDDTWLGFNADNEVAHLEPYNSTTVADPAVTHTIEDLQFGLCYIQFDDAGHFMGVWRNGSWTSPWSFTDPAP